jgi:hypothetical protein
LLISAGRIFFPTPRWATFALAENEKFAGEIWVLARKPTKVAAIALANKLARMAWAMMARGERYRNPVALAA